MIRSNQNEVSGSRIAHVELKQYLCLVGNGPSKMETSCQFFIPHKY